MSIIQQEDLGLKRRLFWTEKTWKENSTLTWGQEPRYLCGKKNKDDYRTVTKRNVSDDLKTHENALSAPLLAVKSDQKHSKRERTSVAHHFRPKPLSGRFSSGKTSQKRGTGIQGQFPPRGPWDESLLCSPPTIHRHRQDQVTGAKRMLSTHHQHPALQHQRGVGGTDSS